MNSAARLRLRRSFLFMLAPDTGGGSGNPGAETCPEPSGDTPELKHSSALQIIKDLWSKLTKSGTDLKAANDLLETANTSAKDLKDEKDAHTKTKADLATAATQITGLTSERDTARSERDTAKNRVSLVESFAKGKGLDLAGIDRQQAAKDVPETGNEAGQELWDKHESIRKDEAAGKVEPGSAHAFFKKNQAALRAFAHSKRSRE